MKLVRAPKLDVSCSTQGALWTSGTLVGFSGRGFNSDRASPNHIQKGDHLLPHCLQPGKRRGQGGVPCLGTGGPWLPLLYYTPWGRVGGRGDDREEPLLGTLSCDK